MWAKGAETAPLLLFLCLEAWVSETDVCAKKAIYCGNQLPLFISWLHQVLSLLESEVLVKMQKHTFYYDL